MARLLPAAVAGALLLMADTVSGPEIGGCPIFPADHIWNTQVDSLPRDLSSDAYLRSIGAELPLHPDFGSAGSESSHIGIPFVVVPPTQPLVPVRVEAKAESDPGPYPIPTDAPIEGGPRHTGDRHVLVLQKESCLLTEFYRAFPEPDGSWRAGGAARFDLRSYALRPNGWSSVDAAGLPILPGLVRYEEVAAGAIRHALRFTAPRTRNAWVWPARHRASVLTDAALPPMGQRFRLRASFELEGFAPEARVILQALKTYGMMLADNGGAWFLSGTGDPRWSNATLEQLKRVRGTDFEAVDVSSLMVDRNSGRTRR
jgi:hypothetical protein